jgi:ribonuclease VapC
LTEPAAALVVDTSAVVAILLGEPEADSLIVALDAADLRLMSAATLVELGIVMEARLGPAGVDLVRRFVDHGGVELVAFDEAHAAAALAGWRRFGKGRHRAGLNLGDCSTYGLAASTGHPVLCVGDDFAHTDVSVLPLR